MIAVVAQPLVTVATTGPEDRIYGSIDKGSDAWRVIGICAKSGYNPRSYGLEIDPQ